MQLPLALVRRHGERRDLVGHQGVGHRMRPDLRILRGQQTIGRRRHQQARRRGYGQRERVAAGVAGERAWQIAA
jgi:hypothetical protein